MRRGDLPNHSYDFFSRGMQIKQSLCLVRDGGKLIHIEMNYKERKGDLPAHCYEVKQLLFVWLEIEEG